MKWTNLRRVIKERRLHGGFHLTNAADADLAAHDAERGATMEKVEADCLATFHGGYDNTAELRAFQHGMRTVFYVLNKRKTSPPEPKEKPAPDPLLSSVMVAQAESAHTWIGGWDNYCRRGTLYAAAGREDR